MEVLLIRETPEMWGHSGQGDRERPGTSIGTALLMMGTLAGGLAVLFVFGFLQPFFRLLGLIVCASILVALFIGLLVALFALPFFFVKKKSMVQEYGNYSIDQIKGTEDEEKKNL